MDKQGRELTDAGGQDELRPGNIVIINGSGYAKEKKFAGAKADLSLRVYWPVAAGAGQQSGILISTDSGGDGSSDSKWPFPTLNENDSDGSVQGDVDTVNDFSFTGENGMKVSDKDLNIISQQVSRALDYHFDLQLLMKCKNLKDLEVAKSHSHTDMGEGRSESDLKEMLENYDLAYEFDTALLLLLSYVFNGLHYELTEGLTENITSEVSLPEKMFAGYELKLMDLCRAVNKILSDYSVESAISALREAEGDGPYLSTIAGKGDPGSLVIKYAKFVAGDSLGNLLQMISTPEGVKGRIDFAASLPS
jgi:hypothetical protein